MLLFPVAEVLQREKAIEQTLGLVKVGKSGVTVAPNSVQNVKCVFWSNCLQGVVLLYFSHVVIYWPVFRFKKHWLRYQKGQHVEFLYPIVNDTPPKLTLCHGHVLGHLTPIKSVETFRDVDYPKQMTKTVEQETLQVKSESTDSPIELWDPDIPLHNRLLSQGQIKQI